MNQSVPILRFAPSPTGRLHLGHAYSAIFTHDLAERRGGRFLLRIEDIDRARCRPEFEDAIFEDLEWLGLEWETPVRRQSEHMASYASAAEALMERGLAYPCFCTRKDIVAAAAASASAPHTPATMQLGLDRTPDGAPRYPGRCKALGAPERRERMASGESYALRLDAEAALAWLRAEGRVDLTFTEEGLGRTVAVDAMLFGDLVIARKDIPTSYHLSVCVDDADQKVSLVTRGMDLLHATHVHRVLQALLGLPEPRYHHHALIEDDAGRRLAKRDEGRTLKKLRGEGHTPADVRRLVGLAPQA